MEFLVPVVTNTLPGGWTRSVPGRKQCIIEAVTVVVLLLAPTITAVAADKTCPKLLMFDGVNIATQTTSEQARYWAHRVGVQGFFLNYVMESWQNDVGTDSSSAIWQLAKRFQNLYSVEGTTDNFIKVAVRRTHAWRDEDANRRVASNFGHAASLARYAAFAGVAIDLEPYVPIWGGEAGGPDLSPSVEREGRAIGTAMRVAYPQMVLVLMKDALYWAGRGQGYNGGYGLAVPFLQGMLSAGFKRVVVADERTYKDPRIAQIADDIRAEYARFIGENRLPPTPVTVAPGLWPLGSSYQDKSARTAPEEFGDRLRISFGTASDYVWIYGFGSAWQTDGPYGKGPVVANFGSYLRAIQDVRGACAASR
jgi:hypothetical protein